MDTKIYEYGGIGRYIFGIGSVQKVGDEAKNLTDGRNCLLITDTGVEKAGLIDYVKQPLEIAGFHVDICTDVLPEPTLASIRMIIDIARSKKPDILIGLGGGSSMDTAKATARALLAPGSLEDWVGKSFPDNSMPLITIPTTAGTAAEVTPDSIVRLPEERVKASFLNVRASMAIVDPKMTVKLPPNLTASTGVDALSHAIESSLSKLATPFTQALALESIRRISRSLRKATHDGSDLEARTDMSWATLIEGFSEGNAGDVEAHWIAHVIGPYYGLRHGVSCGIALPYCMEFNLPVNKEVLARIAEAMDKSLVGLPTRKSAEAGICAVKRLIEDVGLPSKLAEIDNADKKDLPELVDLYLNNPYVTEIFSVFTKRIATREEAAELFENMFCGMLSSRA